METTPGESISLSLRMTKAMALARDGKLREAQKVVADERTIPDDMLALHALAALVTSEGDYLRALKLWELLLQRDPTHAEAIRMIQAIEVWLERPSWLRYLPLVGGLTAIVVLGVVILLALTPPKTTVTPPVVTPSPVVQVPSSPLPAGINAEVGSARAPISPSYESAVPAPVPPIVFSVPAPASKQRSGRR